MGNVVSSVLSIGFEAAKNLVFEKAKYILDLEDHLTDLEKVKPDLEDAKVALQEKLEMDDRNGLRRDERCKDWIAKVEAIQPKVTKLLEDKTAEIERLSMCGYCSSNFFLTYCYGKDVLETLEDVKRLLSSKPSGEVARTGLPPGIEEIATQPTVGLEKMLETTWSRLMEKKVGSLGIYGMGGVGKTTLLKQINQKLLEEKKDEFEVVIFVVVSQNLQVEKIQNAIGERLGICDEAWKTKTQDEKTSHIYKVLAKRRFVMLLDDIWKKVELEEIGIPFPSRENGSKVVFTTRSQEVCGGMRSDDLEVKKLNPENAWELFQRNVKGNGLSDPEILPLARQVCEKCEGLPLAINIIGETMSYKASVREWKCAIKDLGTNAGRYPEVEDKVLKILKFSYDDLKDETIKQCFQYCALFPEDEEIDKDALVDLWIYEGIIDEGGDREEAFDEGYMIIGDLVRACLLMPVVDTLEKVKMHDVLRQMALWVASKFGEEKENFIVKAGAGLQEIPKVKDWKAVRRMSLGKNDIRNISISPECPNLTTLFLTHTWLWDIPGNFFLSMPKLVILDLSFSRSLTELPEEVSNLVSLRYLDLSETRLRNLPIGLGKLIQLRYLALIGVRTLKSISVISSLENMEMLFLHGTAYVSRELIENILLMQNLKGLGVSINDAVVLERLISSPKLVSCIQHIKVEGIVAKDHPVQFGTAMASLRSMEIEGCIISDTIYGCRITNSICFQNLSSVLFWGVRGVQDLSWLLFAPNLVSIDVVGKAPGLEEIISREKVSGILKERSSFVPFRKLRELKLRVLEELKSFYWERLELPSLKRMTILLCPNLKKLPFNKEKLKGIDIVADEEWLGGLEWEDEVIED